MRSSGDPEIRREILWVFAVAKKVTDEPMNILMFFFGWIFFLGKTWVQQTFVFLAILLWSKSHRLRRVESLKCVRNVLEATPEQLVGREM